MLAKKSRVLPARALSCNVISGNISSAATMRIPLVTNTVRMPLVTGGVPFSMNRGVVHSLKQVGENRANQEMQGNASERDKLSIPKNAETLLAKDSRCPWCHGSNIARELKSDKRSLWRCLGCNRRWWAAAGDPGRMTRHTRLSQKVYQGSLWGKLGAVGW